MLVVTSMGQRKVSNGNQTHGLTGTSSFGAQTTALRESIIPVVIANAQR